LWIFISFLLLTIDITILRGGYKMNTYVNEIWEKALEILKAELTEVSFNTWIKSIDPLKMTDSTITLGVRNDFTKDILENRYKDLIKNSIQAACNKSYSINFVISSEEASDLDTSTSKHTNNKHNLIVNDEMSAILNIPLILSS